MEPLCASIFHIGFDVSGASHFDNVMDSTGRQPSDSFLQLVTDQQHLVCSRSRRSFLIAFATASSDDSCSFSMRKLNRTSSDRTGTPLHQNGSSLDPPCHMNSPMGGYAGNAKTGTLLERHAFRQRQHLL